MRGRGMLECKVDGECGVWEGMEGGVIGSGMKGESRGRGKEGCAILLSKRMWEGLEDRLKVTGGLVLELAQHGGNELEPRLVGP